MTEADSPVSGDTEKVPPMKTTLTKTRMAATLIGANDYHWFRVFNGRIPDKRMVQKGGMEGGHKFSVRRRGNGSVHISAENGCSASTAGPRPGPGPLFQVTNPVDPGYWIAGSNGRRYKAPVRRVSSTSFTMERALLADGYGDVVRFKRKR